MIFRIVILTSIVLTSSTALKSQSLSLSDFREKKFKYDLSGDKIFEDTGVDLSRKSKVQKVNIGGLFLSPTVGVSFPLGKFADYSVSGLLYGAKFELAYSRLYPFIFGFVYEVQENKGNADYTTTNFLTKFDTKITYIGGSLDIILNKYIKSDFTTPVLSAEIKYATINRDITPIIPEGIVASESLLTYSAGLSFTIYVLDIGGKYTLAKDYTNLTFQARIHLPIIRF